MIRQLACIVCLAASALASAAPSANVILITVDTVRADRMGFLGSKRGLTPNLDALALQSAVFTHAYAQAPLTSVSHASILTGTYPQFHQVLDFPFPLAKDLPYAPEILRARGYRTAAFLGSLALDPAGGAPGFERGFDTYDANFHPEDFAQKGRYHSIERRGEEVVAHALAWLNEARLNQHTKRPFFLWVHLYDAHDPYEPPEPYKTRYASEPYDGGIAYVDSVVGKLLQQLKVRGLYDGAVIAVMADHGESLGAHGEDTHGIFLYDETIQVPLTIKLPREASAEKRSAGKRIETRVELVDVLPTILQAAGVAIPGEVQGESLLGLMKEGAGAGNGAADSWRDRPAYAQADYPHIAYGWSALQSLRAGKYLYIQAPRRELYDEAADPKAEHNLATESTAVADTLAGRLDGFRKKTSNEREAPTIVADPAAQEKLAALGYVVSSNAAKADTPGLGSDPKDIDNIETVKTIRRVNYLLEEQRFADAVPVLQQMIAKDADVSIIHYKLGDCYMKMHEYDKAVPELRRAVELAPASTMARMNLGMAFVQVHDFASAVPEFEKVVAKLPRSDQARLVLANAYTHTGRAPDAIKQYNQVLKTSPDDFVANLLLGRLLVLSGDAAAAVPKLKKAAALQPKAPEPHLVLSNAYLKLGRDSDAAQEQFEAKRLAGR